MSPVQLSCGQSTEIEVPTSGSLCCSKLIQFCNISLTTANSLPLRSLLELSILRATLFQSMGAQYIKPCCCQLIHTCSLPIEQDCNRICKRIITVIFPTAFTILHFEQQTVHVIGLVFYMAFKKHVLVQLQIHFPHTLLLSREVKS